MNMNESKMKGVIISMTGKCQNVYTTKTFTRYLYAFDMNIERE